MTLINHSLKKLSIDEQPGMMINVDHNNIQRFSLYNHYSQESIKIGRLADDYWKDLQRLSCICQSPKVYKKTASSLDAMSAVEKIGKPPHRVNQLFIISHTKQTGSQGQAVRKIPIDFHLLTC
jgi:hypothetical protein